MWLYLALSVAARPCTVPNRFITRLGQVTLMIRVTVNGNNEIISIDQTHITDLHVQSHSVYLVTHLESEFRRAPKKYSQESHIIHHARKVTSNVRTIPEMNAVLFPPWSAWVTAGKSHLTEAARYEISHFA